MITRRKLFGMGLGACLTVPVWGQEVLLGTTQALDILKLKAVPRKVEPPVVSAVAIHPNGSLLASVGDDHQVRIWDLASQKVVHTMEGHTDWVRAAAFADGGKSLVTAGMDGRVLVWDVANGKRSAMIARQAEPIVAMELLSNDTKLAVVGYGCPIRVFAFPSGVEQFELESPCKDMRCVAASPDGLHVAAAGGDGRIMVWALSSGSTLVHELLGHTRRVRALEFAADSLTLVSASDDRTLRIWDIDSGRMMRSLSSGRAKTTSLLVTADNQILAGASDNQIRVWNLEGSTPTTIWHGHTGTVSALAVNQGTVVSGSFDTTMRIWNLPTRTRWPNEARGRKDTNQR